MDLREVFQAFDVEDVYEKSLNQEIAKRMGSNEVKITTDPIIKDFIKEIMVEVYVFYLLKVRKTLL